MTVSPVPAKVQQRVEKRAAQPSNEVLDKVEVSTREDTPNFQTLRRQMDQSLMGHLQSSDTYGAWSARALWGTVGVTALCLASAPVVGAVGVAVGCGALFGGFVGSQVCRKMSESHYEQALNDGAELNRLGGL